MPFICFVLRSFIKSRANKKSSKVSSSKLGFACGFKAWLYEFTSVNIKLIEVSCSKRGFACQSDQMLIEVSYSKRGFIRKQL